MKLKSSTIKPLEPTQEVYKPTFDIPENVCMGIGENKVGERIKLLVNFEVIEKTKSYIIIRTNGITLMKKKRTY